MYPFDDAKSFYGEFAKSGHSQRRMAKQWGVSRSVVSRRLDKWPEQEECSDQTSDMIKLRRRNQALTDENTLLRRIAREHDREQNLSDRVVSIVKRHITAFEQPQIDPVIFEPITGDSCEFLLSINDWHFGDIVRPESVADQNHYSPNIACLRVERVVDRVIRHAREKRALGRPIKKLTIVGNGDLFSGMHNIHPDEAVEYAKIAVQLGDVALILMQMITELAPEFPEVEVILLGLDNHTRSTAKSATSATGMGTSWSTPMHEIVAWGVGMLPNVKVKIHPSYQAFFEIAGRSWAACHGQHIKGGGGVSGVPAAGLIKHHNGNVVKTLALAKRIAKKDEVSYEELVGAITGIVDHTLTAHFHTQINIPGMHGQIHVPRSLKGHDTFAGDILNVVGRSGQTLWSLHEDEDIEACYPIDTDSIQDEGETRYKFGVLQGLTSQEIMRDWLQARG